MAESTLDVQRSPPEITLPEKDRNATTFFNTLSEAGKPITAEVRAYYNLHASGGKQSHTKRSIITRIAGRDESISVSATLSATVAEVKELIGQIVSVDPDKLRVFRTTGRKRVLQQDIEEAASQIEVTGIQSFERQRQSYRHPHLIMGAGLGGIQTAVVLAARGHKNFQLFDRCSDFGGISWIGVSNKYTKLQTECGNYSVNFVVPGMDSPQYIDNMRYKTWPSRDLLLKMFRAHADYHGLRDKTHFNTSIEKIEVKHSAGFRVGRDKRAEDPGRTYLIHTVPVKTEDPATTSDYFGGLLDLPVDGYTRENMEVGDWRTATSAKVLGSSCICWPGNLCKVRIVDFVGEEEFGGYIAYSSFDQTDYTQVTGHNVILYGHGAFTIENVRTLLEHRAKKVTVLCRKRNICGMRAVSWLVGYLEYPVPGHIMLDAMQRIYDLVGFDLWTAHSVQTDKKRTYAFVDQKTVFGVTDIYFLAGYYGLMEVLVDEISRLSYHCAHLKSGVKLKDHSVIVKAVGTLPDEKADDLLGLKELCGIWINGDPLQPCVTNGMFVQARNFGTFSSGPGFASMSRLIAWFLDYPDDWNSVAQALPVIRRKDQEYTYVPPGSHILSTFMALNGTLPALAAELAVYDGLKAAKQKVRHPPKEFIDECTQEWEMYIRFFKKHDMVDDRPEPAYPYTLEIIEDYMQQTKDHWAKVIAQQK